MYLVVFPAQTLEIQSGKESNWGWGISPYLRDPKCSPFLFP